MAVRQGVHVWIAKGVLKSTWTGLLNGDQGTPLDAPNLPDKTLQIKGTPGVGFSLTIEGSNDGGTTYDPLEDPQGGALTFTTTTDIMEAIQENPGQLRPNVTAGDGTTNVDVIVISQSTKR